MEDYLTVGKLISTHKENCASILAKATNEMRFLRYTGKETEENTKKIYNYAIRGLEVELETFMKSVKGTIEEEFKRINRNY